MKISPNTVFYLIGGSRNAEDDLLVNRLKETAHSLGIPDDQITFLLNASREDIDLRLQTAKCAIHTMKDEHFGISLLEFLHAKIPIVAHRSGGPEMDIILPNESFGYLAIDEDEFVAKILHVLENFDSEEVLKKIENGYKSLDRFLTDDQFGQKFTQMVLG